MKQLMLSALFVACALPFANFTHAQSVMRVSDSLIVTGSDSDDVIKVSYFSNRRGVVVEIENVLRIGHPVAVVKRINARLGGGNDSFIASGINLTCNVLGEAGNDMIVGGNAADTLDGGPGRDILIGGLGADNLFGLTGQDFLVGGSLSISNRTTVSQIWLDTASSYQLRLRNLRNAAIAPIDDFKVDTLSGGADPASAIGTGDVFLGDFSGTAIDIKTDFTVGLDVDTLLPAVIETE